jgi:hypothetical protein
MPSRPQFLPFAVILSVALLLGACASGARPGAMTVAVVPERLVGDSSPAHQALSVGTVSGGSETNPLWKSKVSDADFRQALEQSLALHALLAREARRYVVNTQLLGLDQPFAGFDLTVTASVHYTLLSTADQSVKLDQTVTTPFTANFSDAFVAVERLRIANEGAMRENIKAFITQLIAVLKADAAPPAVATQAR